ncbi:MAG TPA: hypothetical protein VJL83_05530 [Patescibacteria group bacterium]|nr:hypothetical protein [Patescibacteria group bacterium]
MKKMGRGTSYEKARIASLVRSLTIHRKLTTTYPYAKKLMQHGQPATKGVMSMVRSGYRRGDGAQMATVTIKDTALAVQKDADKTDETKRNKKDVAPR